MTEFPRLLETSENTETRALLRAGLADRAPARGAERALVALGIAAGLSAGTPVAAASGAAGGAKLFGTGGAAALGWSALLKSFGVGIAAGTLVVGTAVGLRHGAAQLERRHEARPTQAAAMAAPAAKPTAARANVSATNASPTFAPTHEDLAPVPELPLPTAPARGPDETLRPSVIASVPKTASHTKLAPLEEERSVASLPRETGALAREVAHIDRARAALAASSPTQTLDELDRYDREREVGTLDREAQLLRIDAYLLLGDRTRARSLAERYLTRFPRDAHETRLKQIVTGE